MAGRQRRNEMIHQLQRRLAKWAETQEEGKVYDVLDYACSWVASGKTLLKLADEVSEDMEWDITRDMLMRYIREGRVAEATVRLEKARLDGAHGLVDEAIKTIDDASTMDKEKLMKAKMQADIRTWTAERWNRKEMGRAPDVQITVNNNTLHLDAMRMRQLQRASHEERVIDHAPAPARLIGVSNGHTADAEQSADVIADVISIEPSES